LIGHETIDHATSGAAGKASTFWQFCGSAALPPGLNTRAALDVFVRVTGSNRLLLAP
jgi:hypothetical protein